ncbi:hypothetical protein [Thiobaca trueperi]|uniref:hypothetical protein n=1 Tax=Thiobaca trueperi TaxID=127458 RepID=UPI001404DEA0|nr:hypothetical protein [Thiobaca trueperi]
MSKQTSGIRAVNENRRIVKNHEFRLGERAAPISGRYGDTSIPDGKHILTLRLNLEKPLNRKGAKNAKNFSILFWLLTAPAG